MKKGSLFTGAMGADIGAEAAGMQAAWYCENDRAAASLIAFHRPHKPIYCDIRQFKPDPINDAVDVIFGGSPCQDLSVAGKRKGLDGERSGLFREMVRICKRLRPRFVVWENVPGAFSSNGGRDFAAVLRAFTGLVVEVPVDGWGNAGFLRTPFPACRWNVAWRVFDSQYCGVPQRRRRIYLVASLGDASCCEILFEPESVRGDHPPSRSSGQGVAPTISARSKGGGGHGTDFEASEDGTGRGSPSVPVSFRTTGNDGVYETGESTGCLNTNTDPNQTIIAFQSRIARNGRGAPTEIAPCLTSESGEAGKGDSAPLIALQGVRRMTPLEWERLQGWPDNWTRFKRIVNLEGNRWIPTMKIDAQSDSARYKQIGNGITAPVAEWIARRILKYSQHE